MPEVSPSSPDVSRRMALIRNTGTSAELAVRRELHSRGLRYRVNYRLPDAGRLRPDIAFTRSQVAVFIDGCFWHRCPDHATFPRANAEWWREKLARNVERDRHNDLFLATMGWKVIRIWEHEDAVEAADRIQNLVRSVEDTI